jgi:hypothetical protein
MSYVKIIIFLNNSKNKIYELNYLFVELVTHTRRQHYIGISTTRENTLLSDTTSALSPVAVKSSATLILSQIFAGRSRSLAGHSLTRNLSGSLLGRLSGTS